MQAFPILKEEPAGSGKFVVTGEIIDTNETDAMNRCLELAQDGGKYGVYVYESINPDHVSMTPTATGPLGPPDVVDIPYVEQTAASRTLTCTMGNWTNEPTSYAYQWKLDGADVGTSSPASTYESVVADVGKSATCVVTATNALGSTSAWPSNAVVIA